MFTKIGIVTNSDKDTDFSKTEQLIHMLNMHNINVVSGDSLFEQSDLIITLGGDGTILSVAESAALNNVPVLGINIGRLGYLTDCCFNEAEQSIINIANGRFVSEKRMMLNAEIKPFGGDSLTFSCLNDVCIARGSSSKIIRFDLLINDSYVDNYNADGIIISTPTGSTAYNLSAGGPILNPSSEMIAITPICPHTLTSRPVVVSSHDEICVRVPDINQETTVTLDGKEPLYMNNGGTVFITKSDSYINILKTNGMGFYEILRKKL